ncbi:MAG: alpha-amylase family glycosyl hydrolase [bacterium]
MNFWPLNPLIYEINTWVWLNDLSMQEGRIVTLGNVPEKVWDEIAAFRFDAIWLMGVWQRSPLSIAISNRHPGNLSDFYRALPDFTPEDNVGSPYSVRGYVVDEHLGGTHGLAVARKELQKRGIRLILDFVPNHLAHDHRWVTEHPDYFIQGDHEDLIKDPFSFVKYGDDIFACGKDPFYPAWQDVLQLNTFNPGLREQIRQTVLDIATQCDGVRCDMAMLVMNDIVEKSWGEKAGPRLPAEYWTELIRRVKDKHPDFLFIAEAYWDLEWELIQQGFDFCYDKRLYDLFEKADVQQKSQYLSADASYQSKMLRFIENHDEPRAISVFQEDKGKAAALAMATLPGARLFHEGQMEGRTIKLPVFLRRRSKELLNGGLRTFYEKLLNIVSGEVFHSDTWRKCECSGWPDNPEYKNLLAWLWKGRNEYFLAAINFCGNETHGKVCLGLEEMEGQQWQLDDLLSGERYERDGNELTSSGLYVGLPPWGFHFFRITLMI